jgi:SEC-C motif
MEPGRNKPCPCGSGMKYKHCCLDGVSQQTEGLFDSIHQTVAMNPNLSIEDLNVLIEQRVQTINNRPIDDFFGLTSEQMGNWLYSPLSELSLVKVHTPEDLLKSPVMRYLQLILDEAMQQGGSFKATTKGNLPAKLVKAASDLLPEFALASLDIPPSINDFVGNSEGKMDALHYARILADQAGIINLKSGRFHVKKDAQKKYQTQGLQAFFLPMLQACVNKYNWGYFDAWEDAIDIRTVWLFMLWRLQKHASLEKLAKEVSVAFPHVLQQIKPGPYFTREEELEHLIKSRFLNRFLQFWGFVTLGYRAVPGQDQYQHTVNIQPLLNQTFVFEV